MNRIADEQRLRNEQSRDRWDLYAPHRHRVTRLLTQAAALDARLCVLGAGNCNDLDLPTLLQAYAQVHLVDLDGLALQTGLAAQRCAETHRIHLHGEADLSGIADRLALGTPEQPLSDAELGLRLTKLANPPPLDLPSPFETVASVCLLTQLIHGLELGLGPRHPRFVEMILRLRSRHVNLLLELTRPGGTAVLVLDFVSSQTCSELPTTPEPQLFEKAVELINRRNFFTGANPFLIRHLFESDPALAPVVESVQMTAPWLWDFGPRMYLVCAILVRRKPAAPSSPNDV